VDEDSKTWKIKSRQYSPGVKYILLLFERIKSSGFLVFLAGAKAVPHIVPRI